MQKRELYFLLSNPELVGSPPQRVPPPILTNQANDYRSHPSNLLNRWDYPKVSASGVENGVKSDRTAMHLDPVNVLDTPQLGLPYLRTGICSYVPYKFLGEVLLLIVSLKIFG